MDQLTQEQTDEGPAASPSVLNNPQNENIDKEELEMRERALNDQDDTSSLGSPKKRTKVNSETSESQLSSIDNIQSNRNDHDIQDDEEEEEIKLTQRQLEAHAIQAIFEDDLSELPATDLPEPFLLPPITNKAEQKAVDALAKSLVSHGEKKNKKLEKVPLYEIFPNVLTHATIVIAGHTKKVGKTALAYEIVSDVLLRCPKKNILYINVLQSYDVEEQALIIEKQCKASNTKFNKDHELSRIQILEIGKYEEFQSLMSRLSGIVAKFPDTCLLIIDTLSFYHQENYHSAEGITRQQYLEKYLTIFNKIAIDSGVTCMVTLPEHLMRTYNARNMVEESKKMSHHWQLMLEKHRAKVKERAEKQLSKKVVRVNYNIDSSDESSVNKLSSGIEAAKIAKVDSQEKTSITESEGSLSTKSDADSQNIMKTISSDSSKQGDDEIDFEKLEMLYKTIEFNKIDVGLLIVQKRVASNLFEMRVFKGLELHDFSKDDDFYFYRINCNGLEFRRCVKEESEA